MKIRIDGIEHHLEQIEYYTKQTRNALKDKEFYSPEGYLYYIQEECRELIALIKILQKKM